MKTEYPRVLIISPNILYDCKNQTSITMHSYFEEWPKDNIAEIVTGQFNMPEHGISKQFNNVYILDNRDIFFIRHLFSVKRERHLKGDEQLPTIAKNMPLKMKMKLVIRTILTSRIGMFKYKISNDMLSFIIRFSPDVIYFIPDGYRLLKLVNDICIKIGIKAVPHFMDDWPSTIYTYPFTRLQRKFVLNYLKNTLSQVPACLCISEYMCKEYKKRYNIERCYSLMNCVDQYHGHLKPFNYNHIIRICFAGSLYLQRGKIIAKLYEQMLKSNFPPFEIVIHTSEESWNDNLQILSKYPNIKNGGYISHNNIFNILSSYDILLHVESFDESIKNYTRYSIASKIPEYLSTGILILAIGPSDIASIKYLNDNNAAIIITNIEDDLLVREKLEKIKNQNLIKSILENAKILCNRNHLKSIQSIKLSEILASVCNKNKLRPLQNSIEHY